jgi:hypothetical protein
MGRYEPRSSCGWIRFFPPLGMVRAFYRPQHFCAVGQFMICLLFHPSVHLSVFILACRFPWMHAALSANGFFLSSFLNRLGFSSLIWFLGSDSTENGMDGFQIVFFWIKKKFAVGRWWAKGLKGIGWSAGENPRVYVCGIGPSGSGRRRSWAEGGKISKGTDAWVLSRGASHRPIGLDGQMNGLGLSRVQSILKPH